MRPRCVEHVDIWLMPWVAAVDQRCNNAGTIGTHYLLSEPTVPDCPYHDFGTSVALHCQAGDLPIINRFIASPRAYFTNTQLHHCCHEDVDAAKHVLISDDNQDRCGARSGRTGDVFCEIAPFDEFLCCRTCLFSKRLHGVRDIAFALHIPSSRVAY